MFKQFFKTLARTLSLDAGASWVGDDLVVTVSVAYGDIILLEEEFVYDLDGAQEFIVDAVESGRERRLVRRAARRRARADRAAGGAS